MAKVPKSPYNSTMRPDDPREVAGIVVTELMRIDEGLRAWFRKDLGDLLNKLIGPDDLLQEPQKAKVDH
jgi:hypothetical protein